jgi:hypothetical protein
MDCDMSPPVKARFGNVHFPFAILGLTSQHGINGLAPRADYQDSFAPFLEFEACRKGGSLVYIYYRIQMNKGEIVPRLFCVPLPVASQCRWVGCAYMPQNASYLDLLHLGFGHALARPTIV